MNRIINNQSEGGAFSRRGFLQGIAGTGALLGISGMVSAAEEAPRDAEGNIISGFETQQQATTASEGWKAVSDRKIKVGIAGYGLCKFGAVFHYQDHPNVEVVAASDLDPQRCAELAKAVGAQRTYTSCEEMIKDKEIEAIYIATDAPSHARLSIMALEHDKHVVCAVPAVYGWEAEQEAEALYNAVKKSGKKYMMNETSTFHADLWEMRAQYQAGALGKILYSEGEYWHDGIGTLGSYNPKNGKIDQHGWRRACPPMWYPTHATAYYISVTGQRFTDVSCIGTESAYPVFQEQNQYDNKAGTQIALFKTSEGGISRMGISWDMKNAHGEIGRVYGEKPWDPQFKGLRPPLPPSVGGGGHGGSHGHLTNNFIESILLDRQPVVGIRDALHMTMAGVMAHQSALKGGEWMNVPEYAALK